ncbi:phage terminase, large subunit, PBSX family [Delftia acidovorans]|uniref:PBSX family phage terminase large subunit n=1 Tax=Delftia acidovorans TaxID=80866 RepID=UPI000502EE38|nr:PBSX family phage terminase large subunit [Delftia acidovorans]KFJ10065.1 phage terminase, large subunit, PBSX family [Delftia acidovorans]QQB52035.1 PBSX family phage terminase large subunit [Delftia acidovorans]
MSTMSDELPMLALDSLPSGEPPDFAADYEIERSRVTVEFPLKLRPLFEPRRFKVMYGGRGGAKSWSVAMALLVLGSNRPLRILCAREVQKSMRESVHRLLQDQIEALGLGAFYEVLGTEIRGANGTLILFAGLQAHTVNSIKSFEAIDIVWVEEAQGVSAGSWEVLVPTIRRPGSEIWLTLNPGLASDPTYDRFITHADGDTWLCEINWRDNPWFPDVLDKERGRHFKRDPDSYWNIWEGRPRRSLAGAIYAKEVERLHNDGRVCPVPCNPRLPVHTVWDLGWADDMAIAFVQRTAVDFRIIHFMQGHQKTLEWYVQEMEKLPYLWGTDFLPHDGAHGDFKTGQTSQQILQDMGREVEVLERFGLEAGIRMARGIFAQAYVDAGRCAQLLDCLSRYRRQVDPRTQEPGAPLHDDASHGADVWRYLAMALPRMDNATQCAMRNRRRGGGMAR